MISNFLLVGFLQRSVIDYLADQDQLDNIADKIIGYYWSLGVPYKYVGVLTGP